MKIVLNILCWILVAVCAYFPFSYFDKEADRQEVKVSHILVATKGEAENLKKEIDNGKSFEELATKHSLCESKEDKGNIGFNIKGVMIPDFEKVVFALEEGKVSEPFQTKEGWHLAKVTEVKYFSDKKNFTRKYNYSSPTVILKKDAIKK